MLQYKYSKYLESIGTADEEVSRQKLVEEITGMLQYNMPLFLKKEIMALIKLAENDFIEIDKNNILLTKAIKRQDKQEILDKVFVYWCENPEYSFIDLVSKLSTDNDYELYTLLKRLC